MERNVGKLSEQQWTNEQHTRDEQIRSYKWLCASACVDDITYDKIGYLLCVSLCAVIVHQLQNGSSMAPWPHSRIAI